jgi:hypothetical protein
VAKEQGQGSRRTDKIVAEHGKSGRSVGLGVGSERKKSRKGRNSLFRGFIDDGSGQDAFRESVGMSRWESRVLDSVDSQRITK